MKQRAYRRLVNQRRWPWGDYRAWQAWMHRRVTSFLREKRRAKLKREHRDSFGGRHYALHWYDDTVDAGCYLVSDETALFELAKAAVPEVYKAIGLHRVSDIDLGDKVFSSPTLQGTRQVSGTIDPHRLEKSWASGLASRPLGFAAPTA